MNSLNLNTLLLLAGLLMLLGNVILSAARLRRGQNRAGLFNVALALAACAVVTVGVVRLSVPGSADPVTASVAALTGASDVASANGAIRAIQPVAAKAADSGVGSMPSAAEVTAMAGGSLPDPLKTAAANGKAPAAMMTAAAQDQLNQLAAPKASAAGSAGSTASGESGASTPSTASGLLSGNINRLALPAAAAGALVVILAGLILFWRERQRPDFNPSYSPGLLNAGAGLFVVVVALAVPMLVTTPVSAQAGGATAAQTGAQATGTTAPRVARSATPSVTPVPSATPTEPPTLTPAPSETPIILYTPISYTSTYAAQTATNCTVTALTVLSLRGDPSINQQAIGRVFAGSLLPVTGQSADKKWWRVINDNLGSQVEGWVNADYVKADATCFDNSVPIIGASSATRTPASGGGAASAASPVTPTAPAQATTASAAATSVPSEAPSNTPVAPTPTQIVSVPDCMVMTISAASLRAGPARAYLILGQIPDRTALTADQKTTDGAWLHVKDATLNGISGTKEGWINSGLVMPSASCKGLAPVTLTPTAAS